MPDKYQAVLGEFGVNLSSGQKQRLALARAIVTDPAVLILDESTDALDPALEARIIDGLLSQREGKTTVLISHRPRVVQRADMVVFMKRGKLKLSGSPADLLQQEGEHLDFLIP